MISYSKVALIGCIVLGFSSLPRQATAQMMQDQTQLQMVTPTRTVNLPSMQVGPDDLLQVNVYESPEISGAVRVDANGQISLPMLKTPVAVAGLYPKQVNARIAEALGQAQLIVNPVVTVSVLEYQSLTVNVTGAVRQPTSFQAYGTVYLTDALVKAQGPAATAGDDVLVISSAQGSEKPLIRRISLRDLQSGKQPELNLTLRGGEEVRVPEQGRISVVGNVHKPGLYPVHTSDESTVLNAVAESEGLLPFASKHAYIYRLQADNVRKSEIRVDLAKIMDRKSQDVALLAGDILYIPDDHARRATIGTLDKLLTAGAGAGTALVYAGVH